MNNISKKSTILLFSITAFLIGPAIMPGQASILPDPSLSFKPDIANYFHPDELTVDIVLKPENRLINAAGIAVNYPSDLLALASSTVEKSLCQIVIAEITDAPGYYYLACGAPENLPAEPTVIARLHFAKLSEGWAALSFGQSTAVYLHDGLGTRLIPETEQHYLYIYR